MSFEKKGLIISKWENPVKTNKGNHGRKKMKSDKNM